MDKKTKELLVKMAGQPDSLRKDKFIREYRKYNEENNKNTRNNENNVMSKDGWNNKNNENTKRNTNNETTLCFIMSQFLHQLVCLVHFTVCFDCGDFHNHDEGRVYGFDYSSFC